MQVPHKFTTSVDHNFSTQISNMGVPNKFTTCGDEQTLDKILFDKTMDDTLFDKTMDETLSDKTMDETLSDKTIDEMINAILDGALIIIGITGRRRSGK